MQELIELRKKLHEVHGSINRVAKKSGVSVELVRKVFQGKHKHDGIVKASLSVLEENKIILKEREQKAEATCREIAEALSACVC